MGAVASGHLECRSPHLFVMVWLSGFTAKGGLLWRLYPGLRT
jgi:hypothetical protein